MEQKEVQFLIFSISAILFLLILVIFGIVSYIQKKKVQFILDRERSKAEYEEELLNSRIEISNQSLKNIGWELHDNIGQILSVASMQTKKLLIKDDIVKHDIEALQELIGASIKEIRSLSKTLNHEVLGKLGIIGALKLELDRLDRLNILDYTFDHPDAIQVTEDQTVLLFRILQEFISNVVKHAQASSVAIQLANEREGLVIIARDNGKGFNPDEVQANNGLVNMRSRARMMNASFDFHSSEDSGTELRMALPYQINHDD